MYVALTYGHILHVYSDVLENILLPIVFWARPSPSPCRAEQLYSVALSAPWQHTAQWVPLEDRTQKTGPTHTLS